MRINKDEDHLIHVNISSYQLYIIYVSFDCNPPRDVTGILLDTSKAFDRVWHEGHIYKVKCIVVAGLPLGTYSKFFKS